MLKAVLEWIFIVSLHFRFAIPGICKYTPPVPCRGGIPPLEGGPLAKLSAQLSRLEGLCPSWGRVDAITYTHKIKGLTDSDFILAAKIDRAYFEK
jgi:hypothetical protein